MYDMEAARIIEALRSGIPSRAVGRYFSEARQEMMKKISCTMSEVTDGNGSRGMVISGKYGEGKTHLLNTVYNMAHEDNMVVSYVSLGKETPMDKLHVLYPKLVEGTYLPGREQPGFMKLLEEMTSGNPNATELMLYASRELETDKIYYVLKCYLATDDPDERFVLRADLEGDFISGSELKKIYKRLFRETIKYNVNFSKTKHCMDYINFLSHFWGKMGYAGWTVLFDETELIGRFGKKARLNSYRNMAQFLMPSNSLEKTVSIFALSASYVEDVIDGKHDMENLAEVFPDNQEPMKSVIKQLAGAEQLMPLNRDEIHSILEGIVDFHGRAYSWKPDISIDELERVTRAGGYLLRTKIRMAIEHLDQLYQYGDDSDVEISELSTMSLDDVPELDNL